jgi:hypothetical protein
VICDGFRNWGVVDEDGGLTMTPAMELRNTEYAERYEVKLLLSLSKFHGSMHSPTMAAM